MVNEKFCWSRVSYTWAVNAMHSQSATSMVSAGLKYSKGSQVNTIQTLNR